MRDAAMASRMPRTAPMTGPGRRIRNTCNPMPFRRLIPVRAPRRNPTGESQRNHAGGRKHGRHRSPEVVPNDDAQRDIVLGKPVVRSTTPIPVPGRTLDGSGRSRFRLHRGDRLVLTGAMNRSRDEWIYLLEGLGLVIWPTVTMQVRLVVAADIDSESTKARKARDYGIPIVDEDWLERALRNGLVEE